MLQACLYVLMCQFFCGILLGYVFIQSHNGMEIYSDGRDFVSSQLASTRNIHGGIFNDWHAHSRAARARHVPSADSRARGAQVHGWLEPAGGTSPVPLAAAAQPREGAAAHPRLLLQARPLLRGAPCLLVGCVLCAPV
jgi:hypothetical protein